MAEWAAAHGRRRAGAAVPRRGVVGRRHPRARWSPTASASDGRRELPRALEGAARGRAPSPTSTGRPASLAGAPRAPTASGPATWSCSSCRTGSRPASPSGPPPTSAPSSCRSSTSTAPRRSATSSGPPSPTVVVTADRFGLHRPPGDVGGPARPTARARGGSSSATRRRPRCPPRPRRSPTLLDGDPIDGPPPVDPDAPALIGFTSGTTKDPKGVIHSHRTISCEARQLDHMFPTRRAAHHHRRAGRATSSGCSTPSWCRCCATSP